MTDIFAPTVHELEERAEHRPRRVRSIQPWALGIEELALLINGHNTPEARITAADLRMKMLLGQAALRVEVQPLTPEEEAAAFVETLA